MGNTATVTISLEQAQSHLGELIAKLRPGEEVAITRDDQVVAVLVSPSKAEQAEFGCCKDMLVIQSDDDEHLQDFAEYMP